MNQEKERQLLNVGEVARKLKISRSTAFLWAKSGVMPAQIKIGRASRWDADELDRWIEQQPRGSYGQNNNSTGRGGL